MGALNPLFLLAAVAVGIPIFLHLFQRQQARRLSFPALRYLERTEREHARQIRFRQLLLLLLRVAVLLALVAAGARLFVRGRGAAHPPTAMVVLLDNSLSAGRVVGEERVLDGLKRLAVETLSLANADDRIWVVRVAEPWTPVAPVGPAEARRLVDETEVSHARGDLTGALRRAAELLTTSPLPREIHLLSDAQATAFDLEVTAPAGDVPVVVWVPEGDPPANRGLTAAVVGGGLPPLQGERTEITVAMSQGAEGDTAEVPVRVVIDGRIRGAATVPLGSAATVPLPPVPAGWVTGWAETDPDDLRADDRRAFAFRARPAPTVSVAADPGRFVTDAVAVLVAAGRVRAVPGTADVLLSADGAGLDGGARPPVVVLPPADAALLPALNRRLVAAGIPWTYGRREAVGSASVIGPRLPEVLTGIEALRWYDLAPSGDSPTPATVLAEAGGSPWAVEGSDAAGRRYLLLASPMDAESSSLPVSAGMVRFVEWAAGSWAAADGGSDDRLAGAPLDAPRAAERVRLPSGDERVIDGTRMVRTTGTAGFYTFLTADSAVVSIAAVNADPAESDLTPLARRDLPSALSRDIVVVDRPGAWSRAVFRERQGPELWWPLLVLAALILVAESLVAAGGGPGRRTGPAATPPAGAAAGD
ncbi:MAG: BatA and WFA domain-containing protein [Longimicrobiales bacterium]